MGVFLMFLGVILILSTIVLLVLAIRQHQKVSEDKPFDDTNRQIDYDDSRALAKEIHKLTKGRELSEEFSYEEKQKMAAKLYRKGFRSDDIFRELDL